MRATCRTLSPLAALRGTLATASAFPRNEGVPGSSPGVGFLILSRIRRGFRVDQPELDRQRPYTGRGASPLERLLNRLATRPSFSATVALGYCTRSIAGSGCSPRYSTHALLTHG